MTETLPSTPDRAKLRAELLRRRLAGRPGPEKTAMAERADRTGVLPVSFAQRRMWLLDQLTPGGTDYLMTTALRLRGELDRAALATALDGVVARHEVLRTRYVVAEGEPTQVIDAPAPVELAEVDLTGLEPAAREARLAALTTVERRPVDLATGPVFRPVLVRLTGTEHVLVLTVHHIASDGWSEEVLLRELSAGYAGTPVAEPPLQYADVAAWQRRHCGADSLPGQLTYWQSRLAGLAPLELPTDRPRPPARDTAGDRVVFTVPAPIAAVLGRLGRVHGATPFMVLLAAFQVLLSRYSGQTDIAVGTPVAGRDQPGVQDLVGLFLNTLVLRTDLSGEPSFVTVLDRVRVAALDAYDHQELPFEQVVDALAPERDPARNPLFEAMFLWQDAPGPIAPMGGLTVEEGEVGEVSAKFDLTMAVTEQAGGSLSGGIGYATALFDRVSVERMAANFVQLLTSIAAAPDQPIAALALIPRAERQRMLVGWNGTVVSFPGGVLPEVVGQQAARTPERVAVRFGGAGLTYAELDRRANRLAHHLIGLGVGPEDIVGVSLERSLELVVALVGIHKAGAAYLPIDPGHPRDRIQYLLTDSGARTIVTAETFTTLDGPVTDPGVTVLPGHPAYVIYTSGSTGRPKGVVIDHRAIMNRLRWMQAEYGLDGTDRVLQKTPYTFDVSVWEFFWPLITGATLVLAAPGGHRDPAYLADLMTHEDITTVHFVPSMLRAFLTEPVDHFPSLRRMICSGEALTADLVTAVHERLHCPLHNLYGPTEAAVDVTATECHPGHPVTIGRPIANTRTYILDPDLRPVPIGVPGELMLAGIQLARGYLNQPALTAQQFIPNPHHTPGDRLYRTGDLARYRHDGTIDYLGRLDHQIKIRGQRIEPGEIETVLTQHPDITTAAITIHNGQLAAYITPAHLNPDTLRHYLHTHLPDTMIPTHWTTLHTLPLTTNGKINRTALPTPVPRESTHEYLAPRSDLELFVATAVAKAVGRGKVGVHDRFFDLGGDSMRAIRVVGRLREQGFGITVTDLYTHQSVAELAAFVATGDATPETLAEPFAQIPAEDRRLLPDGLVDAYPMAQTQAGMVYEMLAAAGRAVYQNVSCYRVRDEKPFDLDTFHRAGAILVHRHEILRTSFDLSTYSTTMQLVHAQAELPIGFDELRGAADPRAEVDAFLVAERSRRFDIATPPLLRYHVHVIGGEEWWLTHIECHAILDGWSHTGVVTELLDIYRMLRDTGTVDLAPPPTVRFADFVALEQQALASADTKAYWASRLTGYERFELPEAWGGNGADERSTIIEVPYEDLLPGLRTLASAAHASMKSVLHSAHLTALRIATGRRRFFGGLVCNGRPERLRGDEVRGMYLNTVPFAADLTAPTWRTLVADVFEGEALLWPHRRYPMPALQREWGGSTPLIEVAFGFLDFHMLDWEAGDVGIVDDFSPSELPLEVWTFPGVFRLGGRPSRIGRPQLELLGRVYRHVLEAMAADPDGSTTLTLPAADAAAALHNDSDRAYDTEVLVHELIGLHAVTTPDAVALRRGDETVSYADLNGRATALAGRLAGMGVGPDVVVGLQLPRGIDVVVGMLAVLKAGGAFLPIDPDYPADRIQYMREDSGATVVLDGPVPEGPTATPVAPRLDHLAYVIYTSGSTGRPKGVAVPHRGALNLRHAQGEHLDLRPGDRVLQFASPSFDASVWELLMALTRGAELVLPPVGTDQSDLRQQAALVTHMTLPPSILDKLDPASFPHLRVLVSAGEACPAEQANRWAEHTRFINAYGPTEVSVCATLAEVAPGTETPPIGKAIGGARAYVLGPDLDPVAPGVPGELHVGGAGLARGYLNRPRLTAERFLPDPGAGTPGARMYATGDVVSRAGDGTIHYHGRADHQVKVRGFRVEPGEIEDALLSHAAVVAAAVTVHKGPTGDASLVAYTRGTAVATTELREHLRTRLPGHMVPVHFVTMTDFPLTPAGKIDRAALPDPGAARLEGGYVAPAGELQVAIAAAWQEALGVERVGAHDDFADLGGHSLAMMRIIATLRASHRLELSFRSFVERRTVAGLAEAVALPKTEGAMLWLRQTGTRPPLFCVHPGGGSAHWYLRLAPHLDDDQPVAAFEWPGPHEPGVDTSAGAVAERYLTELRAAQPAGPYRLFSWCGGSGVASEMAHRLRAAGEEVTFVLLDPGLDAHRRDEAWRELSYIQRLSELFDTGGETGDDRAEILRLLDHLVDDKEEEITLPPRGVGDVWPQAARVWREVMEMDLAYRHRPYDGHLHLVVSDELAGGAHEVASGQTFSEYRDRWAELAEGVSVHRVPGDHFGVMKPPHVSRLAEMITTILEGNPTT
ncbi:non-ribosomal peptide synthetase [Amycolatopsis sp. PS_44_ISF1]|uniref:non-ribosomal peptide synthetase n=1 Tax=Amycolatopsis sp. PS_44_ISF1 TaxID=2974917 RepID=UPI0028E0331F|nr:non-ribosomal peptide synthetase [Amycolatopsis sp. PS_44_ISF1]MDT8912921.1 amino acid adenylation domain-containing protein [Amycolatopsis sp. PS_44_ISF1]